MGVISEDEKDALFEGMGVRCDYCHEVIKGARDSQRFCCVDHKNLFHKAAHEIGAETLRANHEIKVEIKSGKHHGGDAEKSGRLKAILEVLADGQWCSTEDLSSTIYKDYAPGSSVADLRKCGYNIESRRLPNVNGRQRWEYRHVC